MKTNRIFGAGALLAVLAAAIVVISNAPQTRAQVYVPQPTAPVATTPPADEARTWCKASELIGMQVRGVNSDDDIGSINELVIDHDGQVKYVAMSFGGFLGMGDKMSAVPFAAIDFVKTGENDYARIDVTEETLKQKKGFNQEHWPDEADQSFLTGNLRRQAAIPGASR
jgi:hemin uptake protein HemP